MHLDVVDMNSLFSVKTLSSLLLTPMDVHVPINHGHGFVLSYSPDEGKHIYSFILVLNLYVGFWILNLFGLKMMLELNE